MQSTEYLLYGLKPGQERYMETLLAVRKSKQELEDVKTKAAADGWERFRVAQFNGEPPDFTKTINRN